MARGDFTLFDEFTDRLGEGEHDLSSAVLKLALIDNVVTPTAADATPQWGAGSGVDYDGNEVATTGNYTAGGETLTTVAWTDEAGSTSKLDADNVEIAQDAVNGFTDAYYGILYNSTNASNMAIGFVDLGGPVSEQDGPITIAWNASGILTVAVA